MQLSRKSKLLLGGMLPGAGHRWLPGLGFMVRANCKLRYKLVPIVVDAPDALLSIQRGIIDEATEK